MSINIIHIPGPVTLSRCVVAASKPPAHHATIDDDKNCITLPAEPNKRGRYARFASPGALNIWQTRPIFQS
ncbi:MAG: hypothetical protein PVJ39_05965 [Gammaproteobacteria bacterium]